MNLEDQPLKKWGWVLGNYELWITLPTTYYVSCFWLPASVSPSSVVRGNSRASG
jgi:hypothetical protein